MLKYIIIFFYYANYLYFYHEKFVLFLQALLYIMYTL